MTWLAAVFVSMTAGYWILAKPKQKLQDWMVQVGLLCLTVVFSILVDSDMWSQIDPLQPLKAVFMPMTEWIYNHV